MNWSEGRHLRYPQVIGTSRLGQPCNGIHHLYKYHHRWLVVLWRIEMIENEEMLEVLPRSLERWNNHNLSETYNYTKNHDLKVFIESEFWWRNEMLLLRNTLNN